MEHHVRLKNTELFQIRDGNHIYTGPNQSWFQKRFQKMAGCGPTSCSNMIWYLSQTKEEYKGGGFVSFSYLPICDL